jgi:anaerobic carbon-monoxide dehydrogenase iron sulfur subunit
MNFNVHDRRVIKCDVCHGDPQCVRFCEEKAVDYVDVEDISISKKRDAALRLSRAGKEASALMAQL